MQEFGIPGPLATMNQFLDAKRLVYGSAATRKHPPRTRFYGRRQLRQRKGNQTDAYQVLKKESQQVVRQALQAAGVRRVDYCGLAIFWPVGTGRGKVDLDNAAAATKIILDAMVQAQILRSDAFPRVRWLLNFGEERPMEEGPWLYLFSLTKAGKMTDADAGALISLLCRAVGLPVKGDPAGVAP